MQGCQNRFGKAVVELYEAYENQLTVALATYWTDSITVGASLQISLASLTDTFISALNTVSDTFSDAVTTAGENFDETVLAAAETRVGLDNTADKGRINSVWTDFLSTAGNIYQSVAGAVGSLFGSNLTGSDSWFSSEMSKGAFSEMGRN